MKIRYVVHVFTQCSFYMQGNYCVHSGSHVTLLEEYKKKVSELFEKFALIFYWMFLIG